MGLGVGQDRLRQLMLQDPLQTDGLYFLLAMDVVGLFRCCFGVGCNLTGGEVILRRHDAAMQLPRQ